MKMAKTTYPAWVLKYKNSGIEIRKFGNNYYVYEISSYYDAEKKASKKRTGKYVGRITETEGLIHRKSIKEERHYQSPSTNTLSTKEYGLSSFIQSYCSDIIDPLKVHFPLQWEWMLVALYCRLNHSSPLKNMAYYFSKSYLSETLNIKVTPQIISLLIRELGSNRIPITAYMKQISGDEKFILIDATSIVSYSDNLTKIALGLSKNKQYEPIFNLLYFYSPKSYLPAYYRLFNGNIKDVTMLCIAIKESGYNNAIIIGDKGFFSEENLLLLETQKLHYIVPLRRNSLLIEAKRYENLTQKTKHFLFENRVIYYDSYPLNENRFIYLYVDEQMMIKEKRDFIARKEKAIEGYTDEEFTKQIQQFGTFSVITNKKDLPKEVYLNYKSRMGIELLFDGVKNILGNDYTYMQNDEALEGWMFINHLALLIHHKIYQLLKERKIISKYSIRDFIEFLSDIKRVRINDQWVLEPIIKEQQNLLKELNISIT